jgi:hypothetical protein
MKKTLGAIAVFIIATAALGQVNLGGTMVPKDKFIVFIFIGHSNMDGRAEILDTVTNQRLWMWDVSRITPAPDYPANGLAGAPRDAKWRLSKDVAVGHSAGRPATPFLKRMLAAWPDYYFGIIQLSEWESIIPQAYLPGLCWYTRIMSYVNQIAPVATIQGVVTMLGWDDGCTDNNTNFFDVNYVNMAKQMRIDLSLPKLPFAVSQQEIGYGCNNGIQPILIEKTNTIPKLLAYAEVVQSSGPYVDDHHYNTAGQNRWADSAVALIKRKGWGPPPVNGTVSPGKCNRPAFLKSQPALRYVVRRNDRTAPTQTSGVAVAVKERGATVLYSLRGGRLGW